MPQPLIRKTTSGLETVRREFGQQLEQDIMRAYAAVVFENPYAGRFVTDLSQLFSIGGTIGAVLGNELSKLIPPALIESYGKGAIVGLEGEIEHAAALLHPEFGSAFRASIGGGSSIIPSTKKIGAVGSSIDVPLFCRTAAFVVSHIDSIELRIPDSPLPAEIIAFAAVSTGGRPLARSGGLELKDAIGQDGLR